MIVDKVTVKRNISGVPLVGKDNVLQALDLYVQDSPKVRISSEPTRTNPRIIRSTDDFSLITSREVFLARLKDKVSDELNRERSTHHYCPQAIEPFGGMILNVACVDKEHDVYVLALTRQGNESFEERLAKMHNTDRALNSVQTDIYLTRTGDEIKINFEEFIRLLDSVEELGTKDLKGSGFLRELTRYGKPRDEFSLSHYYFNNDDLRTSMFIHSIPQGYPLSKNKEVCVIDGSNLVAPLDDDDKPRVEFTIRGSIPGKDYIDQAIVDSEQRERAIDLAERIASTFRTQIPVVLELVTRSFSLLRPSTWFT